jgi:hypothetical protein
MKTTTTSCGIIESSHLARPMVYDNGNARYEVRLIIEGPGLDELKETLQGLFDEHFGHNEIHSPLTLNQWGSHVLTSTSKVCVPVVDRDGDEYVDGLAGREFPTGTIARLMIVLNPYDFQTDGGEQIRGVSARLQGVQIVEVPKFEPVPEDEMLEFWQDWSDCLCPRCGSWTGGKHRTLPGS